MVAIGSIVSPMHSDRGSQQLVGRVDGMYKRTGSRVVGVLDHKPFSTTAEHIDVDPEADLREIEKGVMKSIFGTVEPMFFATEQVEDLSVVWMLAHSHTCQIEYGGHTAGIVMSAWEIDATSSGAKMVVVSREDHHSVGLSTHETTDILRYIGVDVPDGYVDIKTPDLINNRRVDDFDSCQELVG